MTHLRNKFLFAAPIKLKIETLRNVKRVIKKQKPSVVEMPVIELVKSLVAILFHSLTQHV